MSRGTKHTTSFSEDSAWNPRDLSKLTYTSYAAKAGDALCIHASVPHFGPGNSSSKKWRYVLFLVFALDAEAEEHWCDEAVHHE